jgi:Tfp pilus assembly protein PilZ
MALRITTPISWNKKTGLCQSRFFTIKDNTYYFTSPINFLTNGEIIINTPPAIKA